MLYRVRADASQRFVIATATRLHQLPACQVRKQTICPQQGVARTGLHDASPIQYVDPVGLADGAESVRDDDPGYLEPRKTLAYDMLGVVI